MVFRRLDDSGVGGGGYWEWEAPNLIQRRFWNKLQWPFFFGKISTRIDAMAYDEGAHARVKTRLDGPTPEPYRLR